MINIGTININGLITKSKQLSLTKFCRERNIMITFLQETHISTKEQMHQFNRLFGGKTFWSFGTSYSRGVAIIFDSRFSFRLLNFRHDYEGRLLVVNVEIGSQKYTLVNVYCPNISIERKKFILKLKHFLYPSTNIILGGDFNFVENLQKDKIGGNTEKGNIGLAEINILKTDFLLDDVFRTKYPSKVETTWGNGSVFCRLDRFYVPKILLKHVNDMDHKITPFSDHKIAIMSTRIENNQNFGPSYWKCNIKMLENENVKDELEALFRREKMKEVSPSWWENLKVKVKEILIANSKRIARVRRKRESFLEQQIAEYEKCQFCLPGAFKEEIANLKGELKLIYQTKLKGIMIRSHVQTIQGLDQPSSFFVRREQQNRTNKLIKTLTVNNSPITDKDQILTACHDYYKKLLTAELIDKDLSKYFTENLPKLSPENRKLCEGLITKEEVLTAIHLLRNNKCPGSDGLPKEFYTKYTPYFIDEFLQVINTCYTDKLLTPSQRLGIITLICENKQQPELLKNWRPITLLNFDYKIISKILTRRLNKVISTIINIDQTCAIPGRSIHDNIHLIRNIVDYCNNKQLGCMLINLDQSKAFDRVSHEYLFQILKAFGFGPDFIRWIQILYTSSQSKVQVNGYLTNPFFTTRGVRQGCSLSPLLYVLCIEAFAIKIRADPHIHGLPLPTMPHEARIIQYADDSTLVLTDFDSAKKVFLLCELYGMASGACINKEKSRGLWLGSWRGQQYQPVPIQWSSKTQTFYGIILGTGNYLEQNYNTIFAKFCKSIDNLKTRNLSLIAKPIIAQVYACSKVWYTLSVLPLSGLLIRKLTRYMYQFVWNGSTEKVKRSIMSQDLTQGGLRVIDFQKKLQAHKIKHILQFLSGDFVKWHSFAEYWTGLSLRNYKSSLWKNSIPHGLEPTHFYKDCLTAFKSYFTNPLLFQIQNENLKTIYWKLIEKDSVTPEIFLRQREIDFHSSLGNIHLKINRPNARSLSWQILHNILPTNERLHRFSITPSPTCVFCTSEETVEHLFVRCHKAEFLWKEISKFIEHFNPDTRRLKLNHKIILFNIIPPPITNRLKQIIIILVNMGKEIIWEIRNFKKFEDNLFSNNEITVLFTNRIKYRLNVDKNLLSFEKFKDIWLRQPSGVLLNGGGDISLL